VTLNTRAGKDLSEASMRRRLRRLGALVLLLAVVVAAPAAGVGIFYFLAAWTASIRLLVIAGLCVTAGVAWGGAWLVGHIWPVRNRTRFAGWTGGLLTFATAAFAFLAVLRPSHTPAFDASTIRGPEYGYPTWRQNTHYWKLPTGSRIAYWKYDPPSGVEVRSVPIVCLHGGPGVYTAPMDETFCKQFSADGFHVYLFDQAGSGASDYLAIGDYSLARSVADLEAIRKELGAPKMILIGHSWGSTLAANYMAQYPENVEKVVFHSPGAIWNWNKMKFDQGPTAAGPDVFPPLRVLAAISLFGRNKEAAENLVSQHELAVLATPLLDLGQAICKGDKVRPHGGVPPEFNFYVLVSIAPEMNGDAFDPHAKLRDNKTPALLAYSECDYVQWEGAALDYRKTLGSLKVYYFPRAGHYIQLSQPELLTKVVRAFLLDGPDVIPPVIGDEDPRPAKAGL
jgi:pimeloyl-ACP methyl ester carboxylesterase